MSSAGPSVNPSVRSRRRRAAEPADTAVLRHPGRRPREEGSGGRVTGGYVERRDLRQTDGEAILLRVPSLLRVYNTNGQWNVTGQTQQVRDNRLIV